MTQEQLAYLQAIEPWRLAQELFPEDARIIYENKAAKLTY